MAKFYAWSVIQYDADVDDSGSSIKHKRVAFGEEVSADKLGLDDEQFEQLVEAGSVRATRPPDMPKGYQGSPVDFMREQIAAAAEGNVAEVALSMGGSYFGPNAEEILADPEAAGIPVDKKASTKEK